MAHDQEVVGSNPGTVYCILDGCKQIASYYIKKKLKIKVAKWGTPKKKKKKQYSKNKKMGARHCMFSILH
jgi:hypothetical protein